MKRTLTDSNSGSKTDKKTGMENKDDKYTPIIASASHAVGRVQNGALLTGPPAKSISPAFDVKLLCNSGGVARRIVKYRESVTIYSQGNPTKDIKYVQKGVVKLSVVNKIGKAAVVAMLGPGEFFGEACLIGQSACMETAIAMVPTSILFIEKREMIRLLHEQQGLSDRFIAHVLSRKIRVEEDLIDQLFNSSEKRLARTLLQLASYGNQEESQKVIATMSQEILAEMVGTTRSRVNYFMNKFRKLGFIEYDHEIRIKPSLLSAVLRN